MRSYLLSVAAVSILVSLVQSVLPKGAVRRVAIFAGGLLLLITVVSPVVRLDYDNLAKLIARIQIETEIMETGVRTGNREIMAEIIKEHTETYILDKAETAGMSLQAEVEVNEEADYPYPVKVVLKGSFTERQREQLTRDISENLGIPAGRQEWILM